ncbi:MAG: hypothetical protein IKR93_06820 [Firmicutes bacterium]|nr:hypothetical protein [Bacillota bacterium]
MTTSAERLFKVTGSYVDMHDEMRLSALFQEMQEVAGDHSVANGFGRNELLEKGMVWIVNRYHLEIDRMPRYWETIRIKTWVGKTAHVAFTRFFEIYAEDGTSLLRASSVWSIISEAERRLIAPAKYGINFEASTQGTEIASKVSLKHIETDHSSDFVVPYSYIDQNNHMNNCRYMDLVDDVLCAQYEGRARKEISMEYNNEILRGETLHTEWGEENGLVFLKGTGPEEKPIFKMNILFA